MRASSRQSREEGRRRLEEERSKMGGSLEEVTVTVTLTATLTVTVTLTVTLTVTVTLTLIYQVWSAARGVLGYAV